MWAFVWGGVGGLGCGEGLGGDLGFGVWCLGLARLGWIRGWVSGLEKLRFFWIDDTPWWTFVVDVVR